ncbi:MAG TPA: MBL fold metallo-hydrolase [Sphaerochaeta sp.]|nr:MBL fold metallo-hydrolase [Sphaerochaeta sp.]
MNIIIHRGTHQIGGSVTEINTETSRIFIDFGAELPDMDGNIPSSSLTIDGLTTGARNCDGVFFTHYHGDHVGQMDEILPDIPIYMGYATKEILLAYLRRMGKDIKEYQSHIKTFKPKDRIKAGDIIITPFYVDHSAYDAYMFLVEADGKRVLHTGDFRTHGFKGKGVIRTLERYVGQVDALIIEGTNLGRKNQKVLSESELSQKARELIRQYKYVFVICASTNIDRLAAFYAATPLKGKYFICDDYQKEILDIVSAYGAPHSDLFDFEKVHTYGKNLEQKMKNQGFVMVVRNNRMFQRIMREYKEEHNTESLVIYSMWEGYLKQENNGLASLMEEFQNLSKLHTSGHATREAIIDVCDTVQPRQAIIPIHTDSPELLHSLGLTHPVRCLGDGEAFTIQ